MASTTAKDSDESNSEDPSPVSGESEADHGDSQGKQHDSGKSENERRFDEEMAALQLKPWPPLLSEERGTKPRSYSDTSQIRAMAKAIKGDVRSCTSYMHLPHISGQLKRIKELQGSSSSPHLHQSFSRMHLPHINDPWNPGEDFPTVSVIALAEERDLANTDESLTDREEADVKEDVDLSDEEDNDECIDKCVKEHAIYTWNREMGRTRSLSDPVDSSIHHKEGLEHRPRAMSLESADKAKKPPSRLQFQMTLSELEEDHDEHEQERSQEGDFDPNVVIEIDSDGDEERRKSVLVLAESSEMVPDTESSEQTIGDSDSSDEILTRWTRHDTKKRSATFSSELATIDENIDDINSFLPVLSGENSCPSVQALVDEVTKNVMDRSTEKSASTEEPNENISVNSITEAHSNSKTRKLSLPSTSPLRKTEAEYATEIERKAFDKIGKWKTKFASKLEDVLRKNVETGDEEKSPKRVVLDIPMNLSDDQIKDMKKNVILELKRKSIPNEDEEMIFPSPVFRPHVKKAHPNKTVFNKIHKNLDALELCERLQRLQSDHKKDGNDPAPTGGPGFDDLPSTRRKIAELFQWHDQERAHLRQEMQKLLATEKRNESLPDVDINKENMEKIYKSLQVITDTIFTETISRLKSTWGVALQTNGDQNGVKSSEVSPASKNQELTQPLEKKTAMDVSCQTSPPKSRIPVPSKGKKASKKKRLVSDEDDYACKNTSSTSNGSIFTNHVHTISLAEHICHKDTCAGAEEDTDASYYTTGSSAHSCECDFGSDERETTSEERFTGESDDFAHCGDDLSPTTSTQSTDNTGTLQNKLDNDEHKTVKTTQGFGSNIEEGSLDESDPCSEIADLLGVYQVYNLGNDRDNELPRPQAPEPMTYEEKDQRDKIKTQKAQLKSYKRKIREFKIKNRRMKEQVRQLEMQRNDWREDFVAKDNRINDLKREVDHLALVMQKYKVALENKSKIIKQKEQQIVTLLQADKQSDGGSQYTHLQDLQKQLKKALDENRRLRQLHTSKREGESMFFRDDISFLELQGELESAQQRVSELEQELNESKKKILKIQVDKEMASGGIDVACDSKQSFKEALKKKDQIIKELEIQQNNVVEELTQQICEVMAEKNSQIQKVSDLTQRTSTLQDLEKANSASMEEIAQLKKALEEIRSREAHRPCEDHISAVFSMSTNVQDSGQSTSGDSGTESEVAFLKTALEGYQMLTQRLMYHSKKEGKSFDYEEKLEAMVRSAHARCASLEAKLKHVISDREKDTVRYQETACQLQRANQKIQDMVVTNGSTSESFTNMEKKCQALEKENMALKKKQSTSANDRQQHSSMLIEITELQAKLAQRNLEIKELQHDLEDTRSKLRKNVEGPSLDVSDPSIAGFSNYSLVDKKYDTGEHGACNWDDRSELHRQRLEEGSLQASPPLHEHPEVLKVLKDLQSITQMLNGIVKGQEKRTICFQQDLESMMKDKTGELERQETLYKQIMKTKETLFNEIIKEKTQLINMLTETNNKRELQETSDTWERTMKGIIENEMLKRFNELRIHIEGLFPKLSETLPTGVVADALKSNESAVKSLQEATENSWTKVSKELADLKDFTFEMADAIEKDLYSSHDQILDFSKSTSDDVMRCIRDEGYVTRKSVLDQLQATRKSRDAPHFDTFFSSLDEFGKRNTREMRQARRDVLLAAEAVTNTADELHHIKSSLETKISVHELLSKSELSDELTRRIQLIEAQDEVKELRKTVSDAHIGEHTQQGFTERAGPFESSLMRELLQNDVPSAERETREKELSKLHGSDFLHNSSSSEEISGLTSTRIEDDNRRNFGSLGNTPPSRDYMTLRERLDKRTKKRLSDRLLQEPSTSPTSPSSLAWSRDPSSNI